MVLFTGINTVPSTEIIETELKDSNTRIDGLYYLRGYDPLNWSDVGSLLRSLPIVNESTLCGMFINFHFDQDGDYVGKNTINNIYYRFWQKWHDNGGEYQIGYGTSRNHTAGFDEFLWIDTDDYICELNNFRLVQVVQFPNPEIAVFEDNEIYNFTIKFFGGIPYILCNPNQYSFVYLNLEDNDTLRNFDRDGDLLNDFDELFVFFTNPFDSDTDNDGYSDYIEIESGNDPNDYTDNLEPNTPPNIPSIVGPINGKTGEKYDYRFFSIDPEGNDVYYYIDWGDNQTEEWIGKYNSGEVVTISHKWDVDGRYTIKAKAKDIYDAESDWETFEVIMQRNKPYNYFNINLLGWFLERLSLLERLLSLIRAV